MVRFFGKYNFFIFESLVVENYFKIIVFMIFFLLFFLLRDYIYNEDFR